MGWYLVKQTTLPSPLLVSLRYPSKERKTMVSAPEVERLGLIDLYVYENTFR